MSNPAEKVGEGPYEKIPKEEDFKASDFLKAPDVEEIAEEIIEKKGLTEAGEMQLVYLWKKSGGTKGGKAILGKTSKPSGLLAHFCAADAVIWLAADHARNFKFRRFEVEATLFHELCHLKQDPETGEAILIPHDFEGFVRELAEYGPWRTDLFQLKECMAQMKLL